MLQYLFTASLLMLINTT